jgi:hypothetical protein
VATAQAVGPRDMIVLNKCHQKIVCFIQCNVLASLLDDRKHRMIEGVLEPCAAEFFASIGWFFIFRLQ